MTAFDYAVLAIIGLSVLLSVWRGALRELLALAGWVVAFVLAQRYAVAVALLLPDSIPAPELKLLAAFAIVFFSVLLLMSLLAIGLVQLIRAVGLSPLDRALGALFGLARGLLIVLVLVLAAGLTTLPRQAAWRDAMFSAPFEAAAIAVKAWLPAEFARRVSYD
jgi:membrane protein required for colicin V production